MFIIKEGSTFVRNAMCLFVLPNLAAVKLSPVFSPFEGEKYLYIWAYLSAFVGCSLPHGPSV